MGLLLLQSGRGEDSSHLRASDGRGEDISHLRSSDGIGAMWEEFGSHGRASRACHDSVTRMQDSVGVF